MNRPERTKPRAKPSTTPERPSTTNSPGRRASPACSNRSLSAPCHPRLVSAVSADVVARLTRLPIGLASLMLGRAAPNRP